MEGSLIRMMLLELFFLMNFNSQVFDTYLNQSAGYSQLYFQITSKVLQNHRTTFSHFSFLTLVKLHVDLVE